MKIYSGNILPHILKEFPKLQSLVCGIVEDDQIEKFLESGRGLASKIKHLHLEIRLPWDNNFAQIWPSLFVTFNRLRTLLLVGAYGNIYYNFYEQVSARARNLKYLAVLANTAVTTDGFDEFLCLNKNLDVLCLSTSLKTRPARNKKWFASVMYCPNSEVTLDAISRFSAPFLLPKVQLSPEHPFAEKQGSAKEVEEQEEQ